MPVPAVRVLSPDEHLAVLEAAGGRGVEIIRAVPGSQIPCVRESAAFHDPARVGDLAWRRCPSHFLEVDDLAGHRVRHLDDVPGAAAVELPAQLG